MPVQGEFSSEAFLSGNAKCYRNEWLSDAEKRKLYRKMMNYIYISIQFGSNLVGLQTTDITLNIEFDVAT